MKKPKNQVALKGIAGGRLKVLRLQAPMILREQLATIDHPTHGKVLVSRAFGSGAICFEFPNGVYDIVGIRELADEVFAQREPSEEGGL